MKANLFLLALVSPFFIKAQTNGEVLLYKSYQKFYVYKNDDFGISHPDKLRNAKGVIRFKADEVVIDNKPYKPENVRRQDNIVYVKDRGVIIGYHLNDDATANSDAMATTK